jgi:hypothetical protein
VCASDGVERWDVIDALASLVAKSMVGAEPWGDSTRYRLLETLRHFARDRAGQDLEWLRRRHGAYFAELADRLGAGLMGAEELAWRPRLAADLDNLRTAAGWAFDAASLDKVAIGVRIIDGLLVETMAQSTWGIQAWAVVAVPRVDELSVALRSVVLAAASFDAFNLGYFDRAKVLGGRVLAESQKSTVALFLALSSVSTSSLAGGDPAGATAILAEGRRQFEGGEASDWLACAVHCLASFVAYYTGDPETARSEAERGLASARRVRSPTMLAFSLSGHALALSDRNPEEALAAAEESIRLVEAGAGNSTYTTSLQTAATLQLALGDTASAARTIVVAVEHEARVGGSRAVLATLVALAAEVLANHIAGFEAAATLSGAVIGPVFGHIETYLRGAHYERYERALADLAVAMGADAYANARHHGATMSFDEIIRFTLRQVASLVENNTTNNGPNR